MASMPGVRDPREGGPREEATQAVGAVVLDRRGRVLLIRRAKPPGKGQWTLPGGRIERDESAEAAVVRELAEETSLRVRVIAPLGVVTIEREGFRYAIHEYLCALADESPGAELRAEPRAGDDAAAACWVAAGDAESLGVRADARAVIARGLAEACAQNLVDR
jgi:8-oxo-dGTP diphosphatase